MTHFDDLDNTYLLDAVERIAEALRTATGDSVVVQLDTQELPASGWAVIVTGMEDDDKSSDLSVQTWEVGCWFVYDPKTHGNGRSLYRGMYVAVPTAFNYLKSHKRLIFAAGQAPLDYLRSEAVSVRLQYIDNQSQATILVKLPFEIPLEQEN